ncbi:MAG: bifunctional SulP family inorganic anion transporter/carbonic anhydrase [Mycobacteriaceae bacterium]|nr:bifunctional SulP family inorganic anion transporter/carbonic anhydrase [Mycobacteriaceae bacterium]
MHTTGSGAFLRNIRYDVPASLVVFLVALPLSLGIAIASGSPLMAGLIAAVVGGIVAGALGGSVFLVSGPAAGLTVVVGGLIDDFGWAMTCVITIAAGALQILFGLFRIAHAALSVAPVVVHAMLAGIGITIVLQQIHVLLGGASRNSAWNNIQALPSGIVHHESREVIVGGLVIAILLLWPKLPRKVSFIPGALVAIVGVTAVVEAARLEGVDRITLSAHFFHAITVPQLPPLSPDGRPWGVKLGAIALGVVTVALIASVESLLSAIGIDKLHTGPRTNFNKEMIGQGSANIVSGLLGGLPITGVIVRSSSNVAAGARTRMSTILHGVWILLFASLFTELAELIPKAALAGLLIVIGIQLVKLTHIKVACRTGNFAVYVITIACVVFLNLFEGVAIGLATAIGILLTRIVRAPIEVMPYGADESKKWRIDIDGTLSFLLLPRLSKALSTVPAGSQVQLTLNADYLDGAVSDEISSWRSMHEATGGEVVIVEISPARLQHAHTTRPRRYFQTRLGEPNSSPPPHGGREEVFRPLTELAEATTLGVVLLACADLPIMPDAIAAIGVGDRYLVRNIGNLIPADRADKSVDAVLDAAFNQRGVTSVVICGHSSCDAMVALLQDGAYYTTTAMGRWLEYAQDSVVAYAERHPVQVSAQSYGFSQADQLGAVNVIIQMERLAGNPIVAAAKAAGFLKIFGIFFDNATARVYQVNESGLTISPDFRQIR